MYRNTAVKIIRIIEVSQRRFTDAVDLAFDPKASSRRVSDLPFSLIEIFLLISRRDRKDPNNGTGTVGKEKNLSREINFYVRRRGLESGFWSAGKAKRLKIGLIHGARPLSALDLLKCNDRMTSRCVRPTIDLYDPVPEIGKESLNFQSVPALRLVSFAGSICLYWKSPKDNDDTQDQNSFDVFAHDLLKEAPDQKTEPEPHPVA